jgi:hypothetical protein
LFDIQPTEATWVSNYVTDESYIIKDDGEKRPVAAGEFDGSNFEELRRSDPPPQPSRTWTLLGAAVIIGALGLVLALAFRRVRRGVG